MTIGKIIRDARIKKRLKQKDLAQKVNCQPQDLCKLERQARIPTHNILMELAQALDIDPDLLLIHAGRLPKDIVELINRQTFPAYLMQHAFKTLRDARKSR